MDLEEVVLPSIANRSDWYASAVSNDGGGFMGESEAPPGLFSNTNMGDKGDMKGEHETSTCVFGACLWRRQRRQLEQFKGSPEVHRQNV